MERERETDYAGERKNNYRNSLDVPFFSVHSAFPRADKIFSLQLVLTFSVLPELFSIIYTMSTSFPKKVMHDSIICPCIKYFHIGYDIVLQSRLTCVFSNVKCGLNSFYFLKRIHFLNPFSQIILCICFWQDRRQLSANYYGHIV